MSEEARPHVLHDATVVTFSIIAAVVLIRTGTLANAFASAGQLELFGAFVAGIFFTSIFTAAPAIAALGEISLIEGIFKMAAIGSLGAVVGDWVIFKFVQSRVVSDMREIIGHRKFRHRLRALFKRRFFRWITLFVGGIILATPLPNELGVALLGFARMRMAYFLTLSLVLNFFSMVLVGIIAQSVAN